MKDLSYRQIHLDFHTSPFIPEVGTEFNSEEFVETLKKARVESINVFAKCHHGMSYYPTKVGKIHPSLTFDLLGEMLKALHKEGIKAPIYFPVGWEEVSAENANWLEVSADGKLGTIAPFEDSDYKWRKLCLNKKGYIDFVLAQSQEIMDMYRIDGFWYDIIFQKNCVCSDCIKSMKELGLDPQKTEDVQKHDFIVLRNFMKVVSEYVKQRLPDTLMFFNGMWYPDGAYTPEYNINERGRFQTHVEIESLPSELWGYNHFPLFVNYHNKDNNECIGMNGKFHTAWGDFGSLRNQEALEFECFRMIMNGSKCSIGDQMHPKAKLDKKVYERIGNVYSQVEEREPWCLGSKKLVDIGVMTANRPLESNFDSDEGVMRMLLELHHTFDFIDCGSDFSRYKLIILPDRVSCDDKLADKLSSFIKGGGKVLATYQSGLDEVSGIYKFKEAGIEYLGDNSCCPSYMVMREAFRGDPEEMEYVMYERGALVNVQDNVQILADLGKPYFNRTYDRFCSHRHFPYEKLTGQPAIVRNGSVIYISNPLFTDYINFGVRIYRDIIARSIEMLLEQPLVKTNLPVSAEITLRSQENRTILHILHYIAERKCRKLDIVDTKLPLYNRTVSIKTEEVPNKVYLAPSGKELNFTMENGYITTTVPEIDGQVMVVIERS